MDPSLVTVIIPFRNHERYLDAAIRSVLAQTHAPLELILVDDGSTDDSAALAQSYVPPARYLRREHGGAGAARNSGIERASGDYLAFCDVDDIWAPTKLERQMAAVSQDPTIDVVFARVTEFRAAEDGGPPLRPIRRNFPGALPSAVLVRREAFHRVGRFAEGLRVAEWVDWYARMRDTGLREAWLPDVLVARGLHRSNNSLVQSNARIEYCRILRAHLHRQREGTGH